MKSIKFFGLIIIALSNWTAFATPSSGVRESGAQAKPDLIVSSAKIERDDQGFTTKINVTVTNYCRESIALASYVLVTFKQSAEKDAKKIMFVGNTVKALKGGESQTQTFAITEMKIGADRHILVEVDPYKKVAERNEENNWLRLNPASSPPKPNSQNYCSAK